MDNNTKHEIDFGKLRARVREKPRTKAGQVRQAWPEIKDLIAAGHSLKDIWAWLNESGVSIGYARLSHYVGQLRKKEKVGEHSIRAVEVNAGGSSATTPEFVISPIPDRFGHPDSAAGAAANIDPLANVLERERKRPGFNYNSQPDLKKLI